MREEYDFSKSIQNPYAKKVKKQISLNVDVDTIDYFKELAAKMGLPYQTLINSFLTDCAKRHIEPELKWTS
ncbi:MAG: BrnA antitoxin family protein [Sulfurimonas sp.]|uniref:BrnA antitoxin family protein n=1 Tax=Sulfurimonas sp. TaxID=2022749 RepID=UPI002612C4EF|nr:BrnA antitoxin family protein [Sulfurimonas sp.]MDD2652880.1 BrnA antitoxin family protein [Sulfurimonas sp.]MDD3452326.1 BrnA antitoxin family protein [Sulfurimonas sp.]